MVAEGRRSEDKKNKYTGPVVRDSKIDKRPLKIDKRRGEILKCRGTRYEGQETGKRDRER
jgi:hypothetical protein